MKEIEEFRENPKRFEKVPLPLRLKLVAIACVYYRSDEDDIQHLEAYVNALLLRNEEQFLTRKGEYSELDGVQKLWENIHVIPHFSEQQTLLAVVCSSEDVKPTIDVTDPFELIELLARHVKKMYNATPGLEIDGLDEYSEVFRLGESAPRALQAFVQSSLTSRMQDLMTGDVLSGFFSFPEEGLHFQSISKQVGLRPKLNTIHLTWNLNHLINYADHLLDLMRATQEPTKCASLPSFRELVSFHQTSDLLSRLKQPRQLNAFMNKLFQIFMTSPPERRFRATPEEIAEAVRLTLTEEPSFG